MRGVCVGSGLLVLGLAVVGCKNPAELTQGQFGSGNDAGLAPPPDPRCGDGIVNPGEVCDDGNNVSGDGCSADCKSDETCGNGYVDIAKGEVCDDGNTVGGDGCSADCTSDETCGNKIVDTDVGETCDDGNQIGGDGCSANCQSNETCGNGIVDPGEDCDSMNKFTAQCNPNCTFARCGDGIVNHAANEACDDGNKSNTDACLNSCVAARCGDGFVEAGVEQCDDGNTNDGDGCDHNCKLEAMINPSFENNYAGWTLQQTINFGAWGLATNGETITGSDSVLDQEYMVQVGASCLGVTGDLVIDATDGNQVAFNIQVDSDDHRLFQTVNIPPTAKSLLFDIAYRNAGQFIAGSQFIAINIRNPSDDSIMATPFETGSASPLQVPMSTQTVDVSGFAGQQVRLDLELDIQDTCMDVVVDNFRFQ